MILCLTDYNIVDPEKHHHASREFFDPSYEGSAIPHVNLLLEHGVVHADLDHLLRGVEMMPMSEERVERPHGQMQRERYRQRAAKRPWHSASQRLSDNLHTFDCNVLGRPEMHDRFRLEWRHVKRVLQVDARQRQRAPRMTMAVATQRVYRSTTKLARWDIKPEAQHREQ